MREIVHLQAGQCGNQIGAKVSVDKQLIEFHLWWLSAIMPIFHFLAVM